MKTLVFNESRNSPYIFEDDKNITIEENRITVGEEDNPDFYIGDMNSSNATLYEDVEVPEDWQGNRYTFDGSNWTEIEGWLDPREAEIARLQERIDALRAV